MLYLCVCPAGTISLGYGRNIDKKMGGLGTTKEEVEYLLTNDIRRSIAECEKFGW